VQICSEEETGATMDPGVLNVLPTRIALIGRVARAPFVFETTSALLTLNALAPRSAGAGIAGFERRRDQLV